MYVEVYIYVDSCLSKLLLDTAECLSQEKPFFHRLQVIGLLLQLLPLQLQFVKHVKVLAI